MLASKSEGEAAISLAAPNPADRTAMPAEAENVAEPARPAAVSVASGVAPPSSDDEAPWPTDEAGEAAFSSAVGEKSEIVTPIVAVARAENDDGKGALPSLESLVNRIPAEVRETLEELFRAKFTAVRRVPEKALKT